MKRALVAVGILTATLAACEINMRAGGANDPSNANNNAGTAANVPTPTPAGPPKIWSARFAQRGTVMAVDKGRFSTAASSSGASASGGASSSSGGSSSGASTSGGSSSGASTSGGSSSGASTSGGSSSGGTSLPPVVTGTTTFGGSTPDPDSFMGSIYFLAPGATSMPDFSKSTPSGTLFAKTLDISPTKFESGFPGVDQRTEFFAIAYDAPLVVTNDAVYQLHLISDDGARVIIDDTPLIANDGVQQGPKDVKGPVHLVPGTHAIRVEYFQAAKPDVALRLLISSEQLKMEERPLTTKI